MERQSKTGSNNDTNPNNTNDILREIISLGYGKNGKIINSKELNN